MSRFRTALSGLVAFAALTACGTPEKAPPDVGNLKAHYKDVVMGTDAQGETLVVYVDVNNLDSMDEPAEDALKADALARWKRIWTAAHPGKHAKLRVVLRDYFGNEVFSETTRA